MVHLTHRESWQSALSIYESRASVTSFCLELSKKLEMRYESPSIRVDLTTGTAPMGEFHQRRSVLGETNPTIHNDVGPFDNHQIVDGTTNNGNDAKNEDISVSQIANDDTNISANLSFDHESNVLYNELMTMTIYNTSSSDNQNTNNATIGSNVNHSPKHESKSL